MLGTDASFSWLETETASWLTQQGYQVFVQNVWTVIEGYWFAPSSARGNLPVAIGANLIPAAYFVVVTDGKLSTQGAKNTCTDLWQQMNFVAIDVEVSGVTPNAVRDAINTVRQDGLRPVIYTRLGFWLQFIEAHPDADFSDVECWLADYDHIPNLNTPHPPKLGRVIGKQYAENQPIPSATNTVVDFNYFDPEFIQGAPMTPQEQERLDNLEKKVLALESVTTHFMNRMMNVSTKLGAVGIDIEEIATEIHNAALGWEMGEVPA